MTEDTKITLKKNKKYHSLYVDTPIGDSLRAKMGDDKCVYFLKGDISNNGLVRIYSEETTAEDPTFRYMYNYYSKVYYKDHDGERNESPQLWQIIKKTIPENSGGDKIHHGDVVLFRNAGDYYINKTLHHHTADRWLKNDDKIEW